MKILIDESLLRYLKQVLPQHEITSVQEMGWAGVTNGELLARLESNFDVFLTADKNLRYQRNLKGIKFAIIVFPSNRLSVVKRLVQRVNDTLERIQQGEIVEL